jgi:hypothetical protein
MAVAVVTASYKLQGAQAPPEKPPTSFFFGGRFVGVFFRQIFPPCF